MGSVSVEPSTGQALGAWDRPLARKGMPFARAGFHQVFPIGCEEGRALAERLFGAHVIAALPKDRYGNPSGWLHTWSTRTGFDGDTLEWAMVAPWRESPLARAFIVSWREGTKGPKPVEVMGAGADLLPPDILNRWQVALAAELGLPGINQRWMT